MNALFIGRFQPFHNGHLMVLKSIKNQYKEIIIGIGSSQYNNTIENPFSYDERKMMVKKSLDEIEIKNFRIIPITDIHNPPKWVSHILSIVRDFEVIISNNSLTKKLFSEKGYIVKETYLYKKEFYSGREIRRRMVHNEPWKNLVPKEVVKIIQDINGIQRLKELTL